MSSHTLVFRFSSIPAKGIVEVRDLKGKIASGRSVPEAIGELLIRHGYVEMDSRLEEIRHAGCGGEIPDHRPRIEGERIHYLLHEGAEEPVCRTRRIDGLEYGQRTPGLFTTDRSKVTCRRCKQSLKVEARRKRWALRRVANQKLRHKRKQ